jgi:hypothetical protein
MERWMPRDPSHFPAAESSRRLRTSLVFAGLVSRRERRPSSASCPARHGRLASLWLCSSVEQSQGLTGNNHGAEGKGQGHIWSNHVARDTLAILPQHVARRQRGHVGLHAFHVSATAAKKKPQQKGAKVPVAKTVKQGQRARRFDHDSIWKDSSLRSADKSAVHVWDN